eukprot:4215339-Alexandrium_andersonii.AAC.1
MHCPTWGVVATQATSLWPRHRGASVRARNNAPNKPGAAVLNSSGASPVHRGLRRHFWGLFAEGPQKALKLGRQRRN